jgi:8-oxo-dGTP pyrophosphatase MutT (NUDIX family)
MIMEIFNKEPVATGSWEDNYDWEIHSDNEIPPIELITAVACIALVDNNEGIVLTRNQRGWEILAGHIESGERPEDALHREALEEGGYVISSATPFGYRKITARQHPPAGSRESTYPYPTSYIAYFLAQTNSPIGNVTGEEIIESRVFAKDELQLLVEAGELTDMEHAIIKLGLEGLDTDQAI